VHRAAAFANRLGLPVRNLDLLDQALVHSSWLHEHPDAALGHNERLEFLGDVVINLAISEAIYGRHPTDDEGSLSARRAAIVSTAGLARLAAHLDLGSVLLLGEGENQRGARERPSLLASAFEAVTGAVYLDLGWRRTRAWLLRLAAPELALEQPVGSLKSPKSQLQEWSQRTRGMRPVYSILGAVGPDHEKEFTISVAVEGEVLGRGRGSSRRTAETEAAGQAMAELRRRQLVPDGLAEDELERAPEGEIELTLPGGRRPADE
jgi:ribonuclease-3